jgi:glycosyltransferase involved in cell wall biosynthesis
MRDAIPGSENLTQRNSTVAREPLEPLRILQVTPDLGQGGAERLVLDVCREMAKRDDCQVRLLTLGATNHYGALVSGVSWRVVPARFRPRAGHGSETSMLRGELEAFRPHVVHTHLFEAELVVRSLGYAGPVYFSHIHGPMTQLERPGWRVLFSCRRATDAIERAYALRAYRRLGNHFIAVSGDVAAYTRSLVGERWPVTLLSNAIDLQAFARVERPSPPRELRLVTTGRLAKVKNQAFLFDVLERLHAAGQPATLDVLGDGEERPALTAYAARRGVAQWALLHGRVEDVPSFLRSAHIYVHAATYEPFGLALVEAMATGLPVVALDGGGNRDIVRDGENGFLLPRPSVADFADRILALVRDPALYARLSRAAGAFAQSFGIVPYVDSLLRLYRSEQAARTAGESLR